MDGLRGTRRQRGVLVLRENLSAGDVEPLSPVELERLACAAYLGGRRDEGYENGPPPITRTRRGVMSRERCGAGLDRLRAAEQRRAGAGWWLGRPGQRLLDEADLDCVEHGHLRYAGGLKAIFSGDGEAAHAGFTTAVQIGDRFGDIEISTLARIGVGRCLIYMGEVAAGAALLDEAMVSVGAEEVSIAVGDAYCTAIEGYYEVFDVRRTHEWTSALSPWCESQRIS